MSRERPLERRLWRNVAQFPHVTRQPLAFRLIHDIRDCLLHLAIWVKHRVPRRQKQLVAVDVDRACMSYWPWCLHLSPVLAVGRVPGRLIGEQ